MRVITIGTAPQCDFVIDSTTLKDYMMEQLLPVHCQIIQLDNGEFRLIAFSNDIHITNQNVIADKSIVLNFEDKIIIGGHEELYWQQWFYGFGLNCNNCKYREIRNMPEDLFCEYCKKCNYNPPPLKQGFSNVFDGREYEFFSYACEDCSGLEYSYNHLCIDCPSPSPQPRWNSWSKHIEMYERRIKMQRGNKLGWLHFYD